MSPDDAHHAGSERTQIAVGTEFRLSSEGGSIRRRDRFHVGNERIVESLPRQLRERA